MDGFRLDGATPVWTYAPGDARLEKRLWMQQGTNTTYVQYTLLEGSAAIEMELNALVNYRDFHASTHAGDWRMSVDPVEHGVRVVAFDWAAPFYLKSAEAACEPRHEWYRDCFLAAERERGLDDREDHLFAASFRAKLSAGESVTIVLTTEESAALDGETARVQHSGHEAKIAAAWNAQSNAISAGSPAWLQQLVLAADQFIVKRALPDEPDRRSVIAGYHWFEDWGRDTMIALPGLTLATGRPELARKILTTFARFVDRGMLPNRFPDGGEPPEAHTADATPRSVQAPRPYHEPTADDGLLKRLYP